jgi:hypothetical protein
MQQNERRAKDGGRKRVIPMKKSLSKHSHVEHELLDHIEHNSDEHVTLHIMRRKSHQHSLAHHPIQHAPTSRRVCGRALAAMPLCPRRVIICLRPCNFISLTLAAAEADRLFSKLVLVSMCLVPGVDEMIAGRLRQRVPSWPPGFWSACWPCA